MGLLGRVPNQQTAIFLPQPAWEANPISDDKGIFAIGHRNCFSSCPSNRTGIQRLPLKLTSTDSLRSVEISTNMILKSSDSFRLYKSDLRRGLKPDRLLAFPHRRSEFSCALRNRRIRFSPFRS